MRHYLPEAAGKSWGYVRDHCHGLLLVDGAGRDDYHRPLQFVLNPATRWVAPLPLRRPPHVKVNSCEDRYLAYGPAVSPHYQVVSVTRFLCKREPGDIFYDRPNYQLDPAVERSEWPPSVYTLHVLSSRTGRWEETPFARQGGAAGTVADMRHSPPHEKRNAVYWRGALYVHCQTDFVMRISLSDDEYRVIKPPMSIRASDCPQFYLGRSQKGVYCASLRGQARIRVWKLEESGCEGRWVLRHDKDLYELLKHRINGGVVQGRPWILQDINCNYREYEQDDDTKPLVDERSEWSSEASVDDRFAWSSDNEDEVSERGYSGCVVRSILGFHPYKLIIFLSESITTGMAYHLNSSRMEALGNLYPGRYNDELPNGRFITSAFPYTPCWIKHIGGSKDSIEHLHQVSISMK
ncbi:hypothetical protein PVAP13_9KG070057 [Panicum virgatum]|uniref:Uncharacterized protein n=1 Tax=Panicum virgatum TaxID=38727 RepID=A0A8T0NJB3_PANVG|nr:hypothetical protein PVAP13_9KG070057 [Panicum virgatum]